MKLKYPAIIRKSIKHSKTILKFGTIWLISLCVPSLLAFVLKVGESYLSEDSLLVSLVDSFKGDWYINTFFSFVNLNNPTAPDDSAIQIVDLKDSFVSRNDIAYVLEKVSSLHPRLICVDFIFRQSTSYDSAQNASLVECVNRIKKESPLVFVGYKGLSNSVTKSFFADSLNLELALTDFIGFSKYTPYVDNMPRISAFIAQQLEADLSSLPSSMVVNYRNKEFASVPVRDKDDVDYFISETLIKNKIVIIGQKDTTDDLLTTPFLINGRKQIAGIEEIAFEVSSILSYFNGTDNTTCKPYLHMSWKWSIILYISLFSIYILILHIIHFLLKREILNLLVKPILLLAIEIGLVCICFQITLHTCQIPNVVLFATSLLFVDFAYELSHYFIKKIKL